MENKSVRVLLICQARSTNTRLPGKNFLKIGDKSIIEHHICRTQQFEGVIATPYKEPRLKEYQKVAKKYGWRAENPDCDENDVLKRFVMICNKYQPDWIIRTTADCWDIDISWFNQTVKMAIQNNIPVFNSFNEGSTLEVFPSWCLYRADSELSKDSEYREHVTSYFRKGFNKGSIDTIEDLIKARREYANRN